MSPLAEATRAWSFECLLKRPILSGFGMVCCGYGRMVVFAWYLPRWDSHGETASYMSHAGGKFNSTAQCSRRHVSFAPLEAWSWRRQGFGPLLPNMASTLAVASCSRHVNDPAFEHMPSLIPHKPARSDTRIESDFGGAA
jgi:hypothetical protein